MLHKIVALALRAPWLVAALVTVLVVGGGWAYQKLDIEAYPNPVPPLVEIVAQPRGWSAEEVERYVTVPLETHLYGMKGLDHVRSQSLFGLADVKCYFKWGTDYDRARQEVLNRLAQTDLPAGVTADISPWNAIGEVYRYTVRGKGYTTRDLKTTEDWKLERAFKQVDGVVDVVSFGGETKEYHVEVDPYRLRGQGVTLDQLTQAVQSANQNAGGQRLSIGEQSYSVRGVGLLKDVHDIDDIVITEHKGTPVRLRDIATTSEGYAPRLGIVGQDDDPDVVQGTVLMRYGGETPKTLAGVHAKGEEIQKKRVLPPGMDIVPYYDRGDLVKLTTHTVMENVAVGILLVTLVLVVFLGHTRAALITAINIPLALLVAFGGMVLSDTPANLISLGAVDFGIVVDSTVIMMENLFRHIGPHGQGTMKDRVLAGAGEVAGPMLFSTLIIGVAFLPLFTMTGVAGIIFSPMAHTYAFAIFGAIVLALVLTPLLATRFVPANAEESENLPMRLLHRAYAPLFDVAVRRPWAVLLVGLLPVAVAGALLSSLGGEFMPKLEEGNFWIRATLPTSISLEQSAKYVGRMRAIVRGCPEDGSPCNDATRKHPEVLHVVSQLGRPDDGTDVAGFQNIELFAPLAPFDEWPKGVTKEKLTDELSRELGEAFPGAVFNFSQMISDNVEEAVSGVKGENSVKVFGPDVKTNDQKAEAIVASMGKVRGVKDLGLFRSMGQPSVKIVPDRRACARYGLNTATIDAVVEAAVGGHAVTEVYEGEKRFDLTLRWLEPYRSSVEAIREITVSTPNGAEVPLGQIAQITLEDGPTVIYREDGERFTPVKFSVRGRDLTSTVAEAQAAVDHDVHLGYELHLDWAGEASELDEAMSRLAVVVPVSVLVVLGLVFAAVKRWSYTLVVFMNVPIACAGGVLALLATGVTFSVSAAMGFVSIFGIAVQDAILVVTYFDRLRAGGASVRDAAREASTKRLRPCLMTTLVAMIGLLPAALSNGIGAQTQKPLAIVVIGGAVVLAVLARAALPPLLVLVGEWAERREARAKERSLPREESPAHA